MFESASLKIDRAKHHVFDIERQFNAFVDANPHTFTSKTDPQTGQMLFSVRFKTALPQEDFGLMLGDAIHNLRTALDHLVWELIGLDGGTQDRYTKLPVGQDLTSYKASCNGAKTPRADTKQFLTGLEICGDGKRARLYGLHLLDNADKHTVITPMATVASVNKLRVMNPDGGLAVEMTNCGGSVGPDGYVNFLSIGPGMSIELDHDAKAIPDIFFQDVDIFPFEPIIATLIQLIDDVIDVRKAFIGFVERRA